MSSAIINVPKVPGMETSMFTNNRNKLLKLAEGIKTKKKPNSHNKKVVNFKKEPGYANIEHLVFGTYRPKNSPNNLNVNAENRAFNNSSELALNGTTNSNNKATSPCESSFTNQQNIRESLTELQSSRNLLEFSPPSAPCTNNVGAQTNLVSNKVTSPSTSPVLGPQIRHSEVRSGPTTNDDRYFLLNDEEDLKTDNSATTVCADFCSPRLKSKQLENSYQYHPGIVKSNSLDSSSAHSSYLSPTILKSDDFGADLQSLEMPVAANKNRSSIKKLQVQGTVVTVAPSRLCSNTTQSSSRMRSPRVVPPVTPNSTKNSIQKLAEHSKVVEKANTFSEKMSSSSASVRLNKQDGKMSSAFKRTSPARSSTVGICNSARYYAPRNLSLDGDKSSDSTAAGSTDRRHNYLKYKNSSNDESSVAKETPLSPPVGRNDLHQQGGGTQVTAKLSEAHSASRLRKDFAIPPQEFSQTSPITNISRRSSSCSDKTKEDLQTYQTNIPEVNDISSVPVKQSWFLLDSDGIYKVSSEHQQVVDELQLVASDLSNDKRAVKTSSSVINCEDVDAESTAVIASDAVIEQQQQSGIKSLKERNVPKCVRRVKAASSPSFSDARTDSWVSEGDLRRPWSQICSEQDVERLVQTRSSCGLDSDSMATGIDGIVHLHPSNTDLAFESESTSASSSIAPSSSSSGSGHGNAFGGRFSSMRTPSTRPAGASVEGVLQKFRKSFSARFYKKVKGDSPPSPSSNISARHASFASYLNDQLESESSESVATLNSNEVVNGEAAAETDCATVFRLGPIVWRSSKEKKGKKLKKRSSGGDSSIDDKIDMVDSKDNSDSPKSYSTSGSTVALINHPHPNGYPPGIAVVSPRMLPRRAHSTSLRSERPKRPLSEQGSSFYGSINLSDTCEGASQNSPLRSSTHRNGSLVHITNSTNGLPPRIVVRREKKFPSLRWPRERTNLRRSISQPLEIEKLGAMGLSHFPGGLSDQEDHNLSSASSEEDIGSDGEFSSNSHKIKMQGNGDFYFEYSEPVMYAEALWDHVTLDAEELPFKAGDLLEVLDKSDSEWWWGIMGNQAGWFPASFVRIRVNQEDTVEDCFANMENGSVGSPNNRKMTMSTDQVRTKVIMEIFNTERDFVQHLKDVCEGYLKQVRKRPDMFSEERLNIIFGNIEQVYTFQSLFVSELKQCINWEKPYLSEIGSCFIKHKAGFEIYSEYCNNHPQAVNELQQLYAIPKYAHFFEACRLLQDMIDIALDGFLLTPVQKICKYPLQLGELLKYTRANHPDYHYVEEALKTMRNVAQYINERKRRMECLEKLAAWQTEVEDWEGSDLLDHSSELIYSGDVYKVTTAWSRDLSLFLFDHQLIICKKDLLKRHSYTYKNRICVDNCEIRDIDGKDAHSGLSLKNSWKVFCAERNKWYIFATRTSEEKSRWMKAFADERRRVAEDKVNGFIVSEKAKKMAAMVVHSKKKPKKPKDKENKEFNRRLSRPDAYLNLASKSGSLPSNVVFTINKKKTSSGWFHFGSNKKTKR